mmetsp:Transcript_17985/g.45344  ORF Transcript_17985/g.45344 Transcript_17985/m.45344 type:complete len:396 (-) Transcript_17985:556-1743(-)
MIESTLKTLLKKKIFSRWYKKSKKFLINLNFREFYLREIYSNLIPFPLMKNFQMSLKGVFLKNKNAFLNFDQNKNKSLLFFLNSISKAKKSQISLQLILHLKTKGLIQESWAPYGIKPSRNQLNNLFRNFQLQISNIIEDLGNGSLFIFFPEKKTSKKFYSIFESDYIETLEFIRKEKKSKKNELIKLFQRLKKNKNCKPYLFHTFSSNLIGHFLLFHSFEILFFPCLKDMIFYTSDLILEGNYIVNYNEEERKKFQKKKFQIIIESNFRIYVYQKNSNNNQLFLIFSEILYLLPNFFVGEITESSISRALKSGISIQNIIGFIQENLHCVCRSIPPTILNQFRFWEFQKKKIRITNCFVFFETVKQEQQEIIYSDNWNFRKKKDKKVTNFFLIE